MKTGIELITEERKRQVKKKGWTAEHDAQHDTGELAAAAATYAAWEWNRSTAIELWPFQEDELKAGHPLGKTSPKKRIRNLSKAGALIAAEIDRLQNKEALTNNT